MNDPEAPAARPTFNDIRDDYDDAFGLPQTTAEIARRKVQGPGIAFIVIGLMGMLGAFVGIAGVLASQYSRAIQGGERLVIMIMCLAALLIGIALFVVVLVAGINMLRLQHRGLALTAAFLVTALALAGVYAVLFFPFGIWALIVLFHPQVKHAFAEPPEPVHE